MSYDPLDELSRYKIEFRPPLAYSPKLKDDFSHGLADYPVNNYVIERGDVA
ncbi:MAG: hypothetical protein ACP5G6_03375 [Conexivisphaera sp.]|nr:hypothetical protein [Conexivisphaerales archaeon]